MIIKFNIPNNPVAKGRPRFRKIGSFVQSYTPAKTKKAENYIVSCFKEQVKHFKTPIKGPIFVSIEFYMQIPTSLSKKKKNELEGQFHIKKPDLDNLCKTVCDALNGVAWEDDSCVCSLVAIKRYANDPSTVVTIESF